MNDDAFPARDGGFDARRLPEFAPSPQLWPRIVAARRRQQRARRWRLGGAAAAAVGACAAAAWLALPAPLAQRDVAADQRESRRLEREWRDLAGAERSAAAAFASVRLIDAALQAAYDRGARPEELVPLWQRRNETLRGLIGYVRGAAMDAPVVVRI
ncbi:MAG TPA: hypothetical protein VGC30_06445 [Dokdonella sp.]